MLDPALPDPLSAACHAVAEVIAQDDPATSEDHRERAEAARAIRLLLETVDDRTLAARRSMGPGVLTAMHLRRILIVSGHREPEEQAPAEEDRKGEEDPKGEDEPESR